MADQSKFKRFERVTPASILAKGPSLLDEARTLQAKRRSGTRPRMEVVLEECGSLRPEVEALLAGPYSPSVVAEILTKRGYKIASDTVRRWRHGQR